MQMYCLNSRILRNAARNRQARTNCAALAAGALRGACVLPAPCAPGCTALCGCARGYVVCGARKPRARSAEIIITRMRRARGFDARVGIHGCTDRDRRPDRARDR